MDTLPTAWCPSIQSNAKLTPRVLRAVFGDGYTQQAADGINNMMLQWEVVWDNIPSTPDGTGRADAQSLDNFFRAQAGYKKFQWTMPSPYDQMGALYFVCAEWSYIFYEGTVRGRRAMFQQQPP